MSAEPRQTKVVKHPCQQCKRENERWPYGLCPECSEAQRKADSRYIDACNHSAYLSYLANRMMR